MSKLELTEQQKILEKIHGDLLRLFSKAGFEYVEHGERFFYTSTEHKGRKIEVKISVS